MLDVMRLVLPPERRFIHVAFVATCLGLASGACGRPSETIQSTTNAPNESVRANSPIVAAERTGPPLAAPAVLCDRLHEIRQMPVKDEQTSDEVYNSIIGQGQAMVPCLIDRLTDLRRMPDPRSAPHAADFRVGDLAFFMLGRITHVGAKDILPKEPAGRVDEMGVYAYFEYVGDRKHRKVLQDRWKAKWKEMNSSGAAR